MKRFLFPFLLLALTAGGAKNTNRGLVLQSFIANRNPTLWLDHSSTPKTFVGAILAPTTHIAMDDDAATTVVVATIGTNGTAAANTDTFNSAGLLGTALDFYNSSAATSVNLGSDIIGTGADSICVWFNIDTKGGGTSYGRMMANGKFDIYCNNGTNVFGVTSNGSTILSLTGWPGVAGWTHMCITRDANGYTTAYKNGAYDNAGSTGAPVAGTGNLFIGSNTAGAQQFDGDMDDFRHYPRELNATEVAAIYNGGTGTITASPAIVRAASKFGTVAFQQLTAANQVTYATNLNGRHTLTFDGADDNLTSATTLATLIDVDGYTVIAVANLTDDNLDHRIISDGPNNFQMFIDDSDNQLDCANGDAGGLDVASATIVLGKTNILVCRYDGTNISAQVNHGAAVDAASGNTAVTTNTLILGATDNNTPNGSVGEIIAFDYAVDLNDVAVMVDLLAKKWGVNL